MGQCCSEPHADKYRIDGEAADTEALKHAVVTDEHSEGKQGTRKSDNYVSFACLLCW